MRLVVFDVDGTLVDSQADIVASMAEAFAAVGLEAPARHEILGIVGLSLPVAMEALVADVDHALMVEAYKDSYAKLRVSKGADSSPLYPGAREALDRLQEQEDVLLGVATGKSKRGLDGLIEAHGCKACSSRSRWRIFIPPSRTLLCCTLQWTRLEWAPTMR